MHEGLGRDGQQLYPAFPYDHYTHVDEDDVDAIFAYLMTREPLSAAAPANRMLVPRPFVAFWKALYLKQGPLAPDPGHDAQWNRGRYLTEGLAHCGACHTPRNAFGAEDRERALAGGRIEGWSAPALNAQSPAPHPWTVDELTTYLRTGFDARHGIAAGAMAPVTQNLGMASADDVRAIAVFVAWQMRGARAANAAASSTSASESAQSAEDAVPDALGTAANAADGAAIFSSACAGCHERARRAVSLALSSAVTDTTSANLIRITLEGIGPNEGEAGGIMPGFSGALTDRQMAALADYIRTQIGHAPAWSDVDREIATVRDQKKAQERS
jgi:mono/diheme cytochrome c family protein